jgi:phosphatidate cytidylyltransferase
MSNLTVRILTAVIAGTAVVAGIWFSPWGLFVFCLALSVLGIMEFYKITGVRWWPAYVVGLTIVLISWIGILIYKPFVFQQDILIHDTSVFFVLHASIGNSGVFVILPMALLFGLMMASLFRKTHSEPVKESALYVFGYVYAALPFMLFFWIQWGFTPSLPLLNLSQASGYTAVSNELYVDYGATDSWNDNAYRYSALGILFLFWTLDSFAYFGGRLFGKHKLFERISPKKTWEGSLIGAAFCIGLGVLLQFVWPVDWNWIVVAAIISVTGQLGDLVESMFKRSLALKDSGGLLPGHGGILDRFDGFILSMPFIALYHLLTQWFS